MANHFSRTDGTYSVLLNNAGGQRIRKTTGAGIHYTADIYVRDGAATVGVFRETAPTSGVYALRHWNVTLPSGEAVGRDEANGSRRYYHTDHLGSVRTVVDASGAVVGTEDYYPFGMQMPGRSMTAGPETEENFTGHELDEETGLLYAGARYYDPVVPRWTSVDPLADKYPGWSPYNYVFNNPVKLFDPDGAAPCCLGGGQIALIIKHTRAFLGHKQAQQELKAGYTKVGLTALEIAADTPGDVFELITGKTVTLREGSRGTAAAALLIPFASSRVLKAVDDLAAGGGSLGRLGPIGDAGNSSLVVGFTERNLQKGFTKHGADFGLSGNWNPGRAAEFSRAINQHVNSEGVITVSGSYRGQSGYRHYVDPNTRLNVVVDSDGNFVTGYQLSEDQLNDVVNSGHLW